VTLTDRLRDVARRTADRRGQRPGVELTRVDQGDALPTPATPPRLALPAPAWPVCRRCRTRHEPRPHPAGGRGMAAVYGQQVLPDPNRPTPLNREADETPLVLRRFRPWSGL
jgi:hypothetical protein